MTLKPRTAEATLRVSISPAGVIELMEVAASRLMQNHLADGQISVGVEMNVTHRSTRPVCGEVRAVATYGGFSGRVHRFDINVFDETGLIGSAEHTRAVAVERGLLAVARRRSGRPDMLRMV